MNIAKLINFKIISVLVALTLVISVISPSLASANSFDKEFKGINKPVTEIIEGNTIMKIVKDDEFERIVEADENGRKTTAVYDKVNDTMSIVTEGLEDIFIENVSVPAEQVEPEFNALVDTLEEKTYANFEYKIWYYSPIKFEARIPNGNSLTSKRIKTVYKGKNNSYNTLIDNFKREVDNVNDYEGLFIGAAIGASILWLASLVVGAINGGAGAAVALVAAGITGAAYRHGVLYERAARNAKDYYYQL